MFDYFHYFASKPQPDKQIILDQENYSFETFDSKELELFIDGAMKESENYDKPIFLRVIKHGEVVYQSKNAVPETLDWLTRKERVVNETGHSSFYIFLDNITSHTYDYMIDDEQYGICGGSMPLIENKEIVGTLTCSGLRPNEDHECVLSGIKNILKEKK